MKTLGGILGGVFATFVLIAWSDWTYLMWYHYAVAYIIYVGSGVTLSVVIPEVVKGIKNIRK